MAIEQTDNYLTSSNFLLTCAKLPILSNLAKSVDFPTLTIGETSGENRFQNIKMPGEKITYTDLDVSFLIDENMDSYMEVYDWMNIMCGVNDINESDRLESFADITVSILTNKTNSTGRRIIYEDCFPTSLSPLTMESDNDTSDAITIVATFAFSNMKIENADLDITEFTKYRYEY